MIAGLLLVARAHEAEHELPFSSVNRILAATKASRTRAYEIKHEIEAQLLELERPPGRPRGEPAPAPVDARVALMHETLCFLMAHPGCLEVGEQRARYSDVYRHFVLELRERHADVAARDFAHAIAMPLGTLEDWLRSPPITEPSIATPAAPHDTSAANFIPDPVQITEPSIATPAAPHDTSAIDIIPDSVQTAEPSIASLAGLCDTSATDIIPDSVQTAEPCIVSSATPCDTSTTDTISDPVRAAEPNIAGPAVPYDPSAINTIPDPVHVAGPSIASPVASCDTSAINSIPDPVQNAAPSIASPVAPCDTSTTNSIPDPVRATSCDARQAQIETVLAAWRAWHGSFGAFCTHVRRHHRLELGTTLIANILFEYGLRVPARRDGRSRDDEALRNAFEIFFPGAQWVGDGKQLPVVIDGNTFHRNLELVIDAASDAAVGISVRDEEDSAAVVQAFTQGVATTGGAPLALLLDNRPSNHTPEVDVVLDDTIRMRATPGRAQNKAHVEGSFGLFAQKVPPIDLDTRDPHALATSVAGLVATTFFRALNRAPRRDRAGKTRVELYGQPVTPEQYEAACAALRDRMRKQELVRQTRAARLDPATRALLDDAFTRLGLLDPERHFRDAIACYPRDAIVDAIAIFSGKRTAGTLPDGVDARYLLGIVRNLHHRHEAEPITEALIRERLAARDRFLSPLVAERDAILSASNGDVGATLVALVDRLVRAERTIDRHVWLDAAADLVAPHPPDVRIALAKRAARRIHATFALSARDRAHLERALLRRLWPLT